MSQGQTSVSFIIIVENPIVIPIPTIAISNLVFQTLGKFFLDLVRDCIFIGRFNYCVNIRFRQIRMHWQ